MTPIKPLTEDQRVKYLMEYEGSRCLHCGSWRLDSERRPFMSSDMEITLYVSCKECGERWMDIYRLHDVEARG